MVPPETVISIEPSDSPLQLILKPLKSDNIDVNTICGGSEIMKLSDI